MTVLENINTRIIKMNKIGNFSRKFYTFATVDPGPKELSNDLMFFLQYVYIELHIHFFEYLPL